MSAPIKCKCGFFGKADQMNMCSKCYREYLVTQGLATNAPHGNMGLPAEGQGKVSVCKDSIDLLGVNLECRLGDLTKEPVDAIVNAANSDLDHISGLAGAIVREGGDVIQRESTHYVRTYGRLEWGQVCVTSAGRLPCKKVIHAVGPIYKDGLQGESLYLEVVTNAVLETCENLGLTSVSLPAISSGIFHFPKDACAKVMFACVCNYILQRQGNTKLKNIRFTNFDDVTVGEFLKQFEAFKSGKSDILQEAPSTFFTAEAVQPAEAEGLESKLEYGLKLPNGNCIEVRIGDMTRETTDVVVNGANDALDHCGGLALALSKAGGPTIQQESKDYIAQHGKLRESDCVAASPGDLKAKLIIHAVGPMWHDGQRDELETLARTIRKILRLCKEKQMTSVSIPAISTGIFRFPKPLAAEIMFAEVIKELMAEETTLSTVRFTNFDRGTTDIFVEECKKAEKTTDGIGYTSTVMASNSPTKAVAESSSAPTNDSVAATSDAPAPAPAADTSATSESNAAESTAD